MNTHFYIFGSICRGEADLSSDIDLLACVDEPNPTIDPQKFSIYTYNRIKELWGEGNPFAWHLYLESKLIYSSDGSDFIHNLGRPSEYTRVFEDCMKFFNIFIESSNSLEASNNSIVFNLSCIFLAMRNFATCYSFSRGLPIFSRTSPLLIDQKIPLDIKTFEIFSRARILSTRGYGLPISEEEIFTAKKSISAIHNWMKNLSTDGGIE